MGIKDDKLLYLLSLKLTGEASENELEELDAFLKANPEAGFQAGILEKLWQAKHPVASADEPYNKHLQRLSNHLSEPALQYDLNKGDKEKKKTFSYRRFLIAGTIAACLAIGFMALNGGLINKQEKKSPLQNSVSTRPGSKSKIQLPDGTQVWLNSGSRLTYNESFTGRNREVSLSGEAYFDVVKDQKHPFIIHTATADIRVLGTAFNVRSYPNDKTTETALIRGSVEIILHNNPARKIILKPHEKLVVQNTATASTHATHATVPLLTISKVHSLKNDTSTVETSWIANILAFDNEPLEQVVQKIERWYDVRIRITADHLKNDTYSSVFEDESLGEVMEALKLTGNFKYKIKRREVIITP